MARQYRARNKTAAQLASEKAARERFQSERPGPDDLEASGEYHSPMRMGDYLEMMKLAAALKAERERAGLSLADLSAKTGLDRAAISRLENGVRGNPTIGTLGRYASALGLRIMVTLVKN
jgi:ribosome-binding protein aMBF1 (putative translation factor)